MASSMWGAEHPRGRCLAALYTPGGFSIPLYLRERGRHVMSGVSEFRPFSLRPSSGENFKPSGFGLVLSSSAPSPIVPARKLNTAPTGLSSGEGLKKMNIVLVLSSFRVSSWSVSYSSILHRKALPVRVGGRM